MDETLRIVIMDDEELAIRSIEECLRRVEPAVRVIGRYTDAAKLLRDIAELKPDAVLADICMGRFGGLEFVEECIRIGLHYSFVIISGYAEFSFAQRAIADGVLYYMVKPVDDRQMTHALNAIRKKKQVNAANSFHMDSLCEEVGKYIRDHCGDSEQVSLIKISRHFHVNASWLSERFSIEMGMSLSHYRTQVRLERAKHLLECSNDPVASIAESCGFQDASYFTSVFKQYVLCTPAQYRTRTAK